MAAQIDRQNDEYSDKLAKLLPAEGTAALLAINNLIPNESRTDIWIVVAFFVIGIFVFLWSRKIRNVADPIQLGFLLLGYVVWAANILYGRFDDYLEKMFGLGGIDFVPAVIAILYSLFIPLVFPKEK
jgi:drug/metabolite transporter (DMT)-like permease